MAEIHTSESEIIFKVKHVFHFDEILNLLLLDLDSLKKPVYF